MFDRTNHLAILYRHLIRGQIGRYFDTQSYHAIEKVRGFSDAIRAGRLRALQRLASEPIPL
jgi:hypothetical protein